jgi:hypothetical protein
VTGPTLMSSLAWAACLLLPGDLPHTSRPESPLAPFAGDYSISTGFTNQTLTITPEGRYLSEMSGCLGVYDVNNGRAEMVDGHLILTPDKINLRRIGLYLRGLNECVLGALFPETRLPRSLVERHEGRDPSRLAEDLRGLFDNVRELASEIRAGNEPTDFIPVRWGKRMYLVAKDQGPDYCNWVNLGMEGCYPGRGSYLRHSDEDQEVDGLPSVPREWEFMLLRTPLRGKIIKVISDGRARIDLGSESGIWKGMRLESDSGESMVVQVDARASVIKRDVDNEPAFKEGESVRSIRQGLK